MTNEKPNLRIIKEYYTYKGYKIVIWHENTNNHHAYEYIITKGKGIWLNNSKSVYSSSIYAKEMVNYLITGAGYRYDNSLKKRRYNKLKIHFRHPKYIRYGVYERPRK